MWTFVPQGAPERFVWNWRLAFVVPNISCSRPHSSSWMRLRRIPNSDENSKIERRAFMWTFCNIATIMPPNKRRLRLRLGRCLFCHYVKGNGASTIFACPRPLRQGIPWRCWKKIYMFSCHVYDIWILSVESENQNVELWICWLMFRFTANFASYAYFFYEVSSPPWMISFCFGYAQITKQQVLV